MSRQRQFRYLIKELDPLFYPFFLVSFFEVLLEFDFLKHYSMIRKEIRNPIGKTEASFSYPPPPPLLLPPYPAASFT